MKKVFLFLWLFSAPLSSGAGAAAQDEPASPIHVNVVLVQLSVAVTDRKGNYVSGLKPEDFAILEDNIQEKTATFEEGNEPVRALINKPASDDSPFSQRTASTSDSADDLTSRAAGANVFILFDCKIGRASCRERV